MVAGSELAYHPPESPTPGWPANPRMVVTRLYLQLGTFLDYYTGQHQPSISQALRSSPNKDVIPEEQLRLFPQFFVNDEFPPTFFLHGANDTAVPVKESLDLRAQLDGLGVRTAAEIVEGQEHSFDYAEGAHVEFESCFDKAWSFVLQELSVGK